jgi:alpha-galactosidase
MFGHLGVEWNVADASDDDRAQLKGVIDAHRRLRPLLHTGRVVRVDHPDASAYLHGVVAQDRSEALFCYAQLTSTAATVPLPARLPGLAPDGRYRLERLVLPGAQWDPGRRHPRWYDEGLESTGALLSEIGVPLGIHVPEMATLLHLHRLR